MINFIKNQHILRKKIFFSKEDILSLWISEEVLNILLEEKQIRHLINDIYTLSEEEIFLWSPVRFILADKLNKWSYITGLAALEEHNLLYWAMTASNFTWDKQEDFWLQWLFIDIILPSVKNPDFEEIDYSLSIDYIESHSDVYKIKLASPEQALVDLYFNKHKVEEWFDEWNDLVGFLLKKKIDQEKILKIAKATNNEKTIQSIKNFIKWINTF